MFLFIDKPKGLTSHDVVDKVRKMVSPRSPSSLRSSRLRRIKVGHAGTLDPNATGLLIVGVGRESTKKLSEIAKDKKTYRAEIYLGEERDTDDAKGETVEVPQQVRSSHGAKSVRDDKVGLNSLPTLSKSQVEEVLRSFVGEQEQIPPAYSAIKIKGKKAYEIARKGGIPELSPRKITIHSIKLLEYEFPILKIETEVSSGTYIRALARDIGRKLGAGAYLKNLRRTKIGGYSLKESVSLEYLNKDNWKKFAINL